MRFTQPDLHYRKRMVASAKILMGGGIDAHLLVWLEEKGDARIDRGDLSASE